MKRVCLIFLLLMSAGGPFAAEQAKPDFLVFNGLCDASAAVALDDKHFVVASDEDSKLRVYRLDSPRLPVQVFDMHAFLELDQEHPETDIEAAASLGGIVYWITSHGRNVEGKVRPSRERLFATRIVPSAAGYEIIPIGNACKNLLTSMKNDSRLDRLGLSMAATKAPKDAGGLNIEGLAATPDGKLLIGFRNPVPGKLALVVPLLNPTEVIAGGKP
ncbi:MAG: DUF3616 domain-containing protein, partial [Verrucomicrobiae bacterium]|nr:DUF3616 domain-containing protein [Verrucomicrobiae bacterium]